VDRRQVSWPTGSIAQAEVRANHAAGKSRLVVLQPLNAPEPPAKDHSRRLGGNVIDRLSVRAVRRDSP
jgi:hypothetical protein